MRKLVYILSLLWMAGMVGACRQTDGTGRDMDSTALRLGVLPTVDCLPFYYADSMGLFDSAGIQVKLVTFDAGMDADTAYMNGSIDGIVTDLVKACIWQGQGDTAQVVMVGDLRLWLVTAPKARLLSVESLKEKIIGITRLSAVDYFTDRILSLAKMQSLDLNKPQINEIKLRTLMVDQDQYDGAILPEPFASEAVARGAKRLTGTEDLKVERLLCVLFGDSIGKVRKDDVGKIRQVYDLAVERLNADTLSNVLEYIPEAHRMYLPDTFYIYKPLNASVAFDDSMLVDVKAWVKENEFLGQGAKGKTK